MKTLILLIAAISLTGCAQSGYKKFYKPYVDANTLTDVELISEDQEPEVFGSDNIKRDHYILLSKGYIAVGQSTFNGGHEDIKYAKAQAKSVGATVILASSQYTNTQTTTTTLLVPDNKTTYHSGSAYSNTSYDSAYGGYYGNSSTYGTYNGTSTTYATKAVPVTSQQRRYDQTAVYYVKSNKKYRIGVLYLDLTPEQRIQYERNTGIQIIVVVEETPAFYSNILAGDVLIAIDGDTVNNVIQAGEILDGIPATQNRTVFTVIRNGQEKNIQVKLL